MAISSTSPARLREMVRGAYSAAAEQPQQKHAFPVGRQFAEKSRLSHRVACQLSALVILTHVDLLGSVQSRNQPLRVPAVYHILFAECLSQRGFLNMNPVKQRRSRWHERRSECNPIAGMQPDP